LAPGRASRGGETPSPRGGTPSRPGDGSSRLTVALVRGFRGLRGQVRVELLTDRPEDRFTVGARLYPEGTGERLTVAEALPVADGPGWWLRFREIGDRNAAEERLRDRYLEIDDPHEPREPGRWFWHELEGLAVSSTDGQPLGEVVEVYRAGGAEVFVVRGPRGELDVPGVTGIVTELAPDRGVIVVDLDRLALDARPVDDADYVRPRDRRPRKQRKGRPGAASAEAMPNERTEAAPSPPPDVDADD
jgi:16S rRNA processing protein RimM